ncbi:hypothetical protein ACOMHN_034007 [Nucella lapillus]
MSDDDLEDVDLEIDIDMPETPVSQRGGRGRYSNRSGVGVKSAGQKSADNSEVENQVNLTSRLNQRLSDLFGTQQGVDYERLYKCLVSAHNLTAPISPIPPWELIKPRIIDTYETKETKHTNPLYLATLAKTRVHEEFGQHLQIYTDGSVKDNGEVGCALVIPDLGITKKYHLNNGIGIYTAELYAILKACETINDMPQPPRAAVILTDSKSSLQGLASGRTKNRQEFQAEISFLTHQILYKGTDLTLMWLPSHTGIKGNELADKAAKRATEDGTHVTLQLSTLEMKNKIRQTANKIRNDTFKTRCTEHGWVFIPMPKTSPRLTLPRKNQKLLRRIRTGHHRSTSQNITCQCGKEATLQHIFSDCPSLNSSTTKLKDYKQKHSLGTQDFLLPHPTLGTQPIRLLTDTIMNSETDQWF